MSDLFQPGDERAGDHLTQASFAAAMVEVEAAWLEVLADSGLAPASSAASDGPHVLSGLVTASDVDGLARSAATGGTPVIGLVGLLRERLTARGSAEAASWLHRGLTSQDVVDTALVLCARRAVTALTTDLDRQVRLLAALARRHRDTPQVARTLTQHAVPTTFGLTVAQWLTGVLDAGEALAGLRFPVQLGGAAGTMAAAVELGLDPSGARSGLARRLGLADVPSWHGSRAPVTRLGDALVTCADAWGHLAHDVLTLSRPELGELSEGVGGGSSTMPHKANPVLSVLVRRTALAAPMLGATLHLAAVDQADQRAAGGWQAEWSVLRDLVRGTLAAGSLVAELLEGLVVHADRMAATLEAARDDVHAEQRSMAGLAGHQPSGDYLGAAGTLVDEVLARAEQVPVVAVTTTSWGGPDGAPLLVLGPSLGTSAESLWGACAALLTDRFRVVGWDLPGHGGNRRPLPTGGSVTMASLAADVLGAVDGPFAYAGDSVGGAVGLQLLLDAPDRVTAAVLACTGARIGSAESWAERARQVRGSGTPSVVAASAQRWFGPGFLDREPARGSALLHALSDADDEGYAAVCGALGGFDVRDRLGEVTHPVLAVAGEHDVATPPASLAEIADSVRDGRLVVLPGVAHLAPAEAPAALAELIAQHLSRHLGRHLSEQPSRHPTHTEEST